MKTRSEKNLARVEGGRKYKKRDSGGRLAEKLFQAISMKST